MGQIGTSRSKGGLLKTGQTTVYGGYADDGHYRKGLSKKYTVLTTGQYAGTKNITLNGKTEAKTNNCVYDVRTKLMWCRTGSGSVGPSSNGNLPFTTNGSGEGIFTYVAAANAALLGGFSDWRVPNLFELMSLLDFEAPTCAPDGTAFPSWVTSGYFWSSTTDPSATTNALVVSFNNSQIAQGPKTSNYRTALVRGG